MLQDYLEKSILVSSVVRSDFDFSCVFSRDIFVIYPSRHAGSVMPPRLSINIRWPKLPICESSGKLGWKRCLYIDQKRINNLIFWRWLECPFKVDPSTPKRSTPWGYILTPVWSANVWRCCVVSSQWQEIDSLSVNKSVIPGLNHYNLQSSKHDSIRFTVPGQFVKRIWIKSHWPPVL